MIWSTMLVPKADGSGALWVESRRWTWTLKTRLGISGLVPPLPSDVASLSVFDLAESDTAPLFQFQPKVSIWAGRNPTDI